MPNDLEPAASPSGTRLAGLSLAALGVVYGDIGTSPLYALRECFGGPHGFAATAGNILGVLSLIFWALVLVISLKYIVFIMRADNEGEGGILALMALAVHERKGGGRAALVVMGLFGASLLYGDGMITPAISVLSAVEGLAVAAPAVSHFVIPLTVAILAGLFLFQHKGTGGVGKVFGPVILFWFVLLAALGAPHIWAHPAILGALNPLHALDFFMRNGGTGFLVLASVFLVVTGGEALYADMGHFGTRPIRLGWFAVVLPGLLVNYFGQGAFLLAHPEAVRNPFYLMAPSWALYPLVFLATVATVIASQAVISGAFSLTMQAVQMGYSPRMIIRHTSDTEKGQIYMPTINWVLMASAIGLVLGFESSSNLAAAYGLAVTLTMVITTILFYALLRHRWNWRPWTAGLLCGGFLVMDLSFFGANIIKILHGGWFPLLIAGLAYLLLATWKAGRGVLSRRMRDAALPVEQFMDQLDQAPPIRVPGTAVFMAGNPDVLPSALLNNLRHNKVLHERVVLLNVETGDIPRVPERQRIVMEPMGRGIYRVRLRYGFMQNPRVPQALARLRLDDWDFDIHDSTFFLGRESLLVSARSGLPKFVERLFTVMSRNAQPATIFFDLPPERVVELGAQIEL